MELEYLNKARGGLIVPRLGKMRNRSDPVIQLLRILPSLPISRFRLARLCS